MKRSMIFLGLTFLLLSVRAQHYQSRIIENPGFASIQNGLSVRSNDAVFTFHRIMSTHGESFILMCSYDVNGTLLFRKKIFSNEDSRHLSTAVVSNDKILLIGDYNFGGSAEQGLGFYVLKISFDGEPLGCSIYRIADFNDHLITDAKVLKTGKIALVGKTGYYQGNNYFTYCELDPEGVPTLARTFFANSIDKVVIGEDDGGGKILLDDKYRLELDANNQISSAAVTNYSNGMRPQQLEYIGNRNWIIRSGSGIYKWNKAQEKLTSLLGGFSEGMIVDRDTKQLTGFAKNEAAVTDFNGNVSFSVSASGQHFESSTGTMLCNDRIFMSAYNSNPGTISAMTIDQSNIGTCFSSTVPAKDSVTVSVSNAPGNLSGYVDQTISSGTIPVRGENWDGELNTACSADRCHYVDMPTDTVICEGVSFELFPYENVSSCGSVRNYIWDDGEQNINRIITQTGVYTLTVAEEGCSQNATVKVLFRNPEECSAGLYMPGAFTPDGDGVNEIFTPITMAIQYYNIDIFDRWGQLLYSAKTNDPGWNGKYLGADCPQGVYLWKLTYSSAVDPAVKKQESGKVQLLR